MHCTLHPNQHFFFPECYWFILSARFLKVHLAASYHVHNCHLALGLLCLWQWGQKLYNSAAVVGRQYTFNLDERKYCLAATLPCKVVYWDSPNFWTKMLVVPVSLHKTYPLALLCCFGCNHNNGQELRSHRYHLGMYPWITVFCFMLFQLLQVSVSTMWLHFHNPWL